MTLEKKAVTKELLDDLLADYRKPEDLSGENEAVENPAGNMRNGRSRKTLKGEFGELPIETPRDRHGTFEPQLIPKRRGAAHTLLSGAQKHQQEMDDADSGQGSGVKPICYPVRRTGETALTLNPFTQNSGHPVRTRLQCCHRRPFSNLEGEAASQ